MSYKSLSVSLTKYKPNEIVCILVIIALAVVIPRYVKLPKNVELLFNDRIGQLLLLLLAVMIGSYNFVCGVLLVVLFLSIILTVSKSNSIEVFENESEAEDDDMEDFIKYLKAYTNELNEANCNCVFEAEYQGRDVKLGKPTRGDVKKFKVYVKNPAGNVVKVNFGHGGTSAASKGEKTMRIRKSNPDARKSFRARHNCDEPGPRHKARYWSCRKW